jgi:hypothetical protein
VDAHPSLITSKSGPSRQRSIFEWNITGNVHARSEETDPSIVYSAGPFRSVTVQIVKKAQDQCVIPDEDPNCPISLDQDDEEGDSFDLMGDGVGNEDDGGEEEDNVYEHGETTAKPRNQQSLPAAVKDEYDRHLEYLKQTPSGFKPCLYENLHTFWLPYQANFFLLNRSNKPHPSQLYNHCWLYWDPDHLVEGGLKCPNCSAHLHCQLHPSMMCC